MTSATTTAHSLLTDFNLPDTLISCYKANGITSLFEWQAECLSQAGVLTGTNLVYSAPTSAGKTLVAEVVMLKRLLESNHKALYVLPFISVAREKMFTLSNTFKCVGLKVEGYMGSVSASGGLHSWDVAVCTIEKANGIVNRLMEDDSLSMIGTVIVDELHIINEGSRGGILENLLSKILYYNRSEGQKDDSRTTFSRLQIIGMSATLPNQDSLARWLGAISYKTNYRPVRLSEYVFSGGVYYDMNFQAVRRLSDKYCLPNDNDNIVGLCLETVATNGGVLIFCSTKSWCEKLAANIANAFCSLQQYSGEVAETLRNLIIASKQQKFVEEFKDLIGFIDSVLQFTMMFCVAFHHAGLTAEERERVEDGFRRGFIRILVATSTLCAGVNLPAKRVIIRSVWSSGNRPGPNLTALLYKQMSGRAGRTGLDTEGIVISSLHHGLSVQLHYCHQFSSRQSA